MKRILVIGGTGMLGGVVDHLVKSGGKVTVLARSRDKFNGMLDRFGLSEQGTVFLPVDYFDTSALTGALMEHIKLYGTFDEAVIWMRSSAKESFEAVMEFLNRTCSPAEVFRVNGSSAARQPLPENHYQSINMHHIILGFKIENGESRWLHEEEISEGVIAALVTRIPRTIIGVTEPWHRRPGY
ncbi:hypothetical protein [Bacillus sp. P14.5]|uniref:hypothetical protein n=1 Tax=Bacillus sp. P14.5 TaxID=1983400 RepID=UPI000DE84AF8|nr:hypothetical protein [Bacillus sp. P14.5]